jgi:hypothetical protein
MLCGGNFMTTKTWPCRELLEAAPSTTMVILHFPEGDGAIAAPAGRAAR